MKKKRILVALVLSAAMVLMAGQALAALPTTGTIFTTDAGCTGVDLNIYGAKSDVYLNGGPDRPGTAGMADGWYYIRVTTPAGDVLGGQAATATGGQAQVVAGKFVGCYQLTDILYTASSGFTVKGYDDSWNGEYKAWASQDPLFSNNQSKTDNFRVKPSVALPPTAELKVKAFYDANANGIDDDGQALAGWKVNVHDGIDWDRYVPADMILTPDDYTVAGYKPIETNWVATTPSTTVLTLDAGDVKTVTIGETCLGAGGGRTLGFWSNKNGQAAMQTLAPYGFLTGLNLRDARGNSFDPAGYSQFRTWLLNATATNMPYMLSAQLAAMELNVKAGFVRVSALVHAPALLSSPPVAGLNSLGFISVDNLMAAANAELGVHGTAFSGDGWRAYQEALKSALDSANNNLNFVQPTACALTFGG
ncbi:MAG: hypothetical protein HYX94_05700 [Chloroflexi bacterium]|nr:hypothetical protein [Chloroflexota bacterium]